MCVCFVLLFFSGCILFSGVEPLNEGNIFFCKILLRSVHWLTRISHSKFFPILSSGGYLVEWSETV